MRILLFVLATLVSAASFAQKGIGSWRTFPSFTDARLVVHGDNRIFGAAKTSIFEFDENNNIFSVYDKSNSMSDVNPTALQFHDSLRLLVVGYQNGNLDFIGDFETFNISDIKRTNTVTGSKVINQITFRGDKAYLSCGFGIVVIDLVNKEILDTYKIGTNGITTNVYDVDFYDGRIWAGTSEGLKSADLANPFLANFQNWELETRVSYGNYTQVEQFGDILYVTYRHIKPSENSFATDTLYHYNGTTFTPSISPVQGHYLDLKKVGDKIALSGQYSTIEFTTDDYGIGDVVNTHNVGDVPMDLAYDHNGDIWYAFEDQGFKIFKNGNYTQNNPNGPSSSSTYSISAYNGQIWFSAGSISSNFSNTFNKEGISGFVNGTWRSYTWKNEALMEQNKMYDVLQILINPENTSQVYAGSFFGGVVEFKGHDIIDFYKSNNSTISDRTVYAGSFSTPSLSVDFSGNLWVCNSNTANPFVVRKPNGDWIGIPVNNLNPDDALMHKMITATNGLTYAIRPGIGLLVFDPNGTLESFSDDRNKTLTTTVNEGGLPSGNVYCVTEDIDGEIWVGTDKGPAIYFNANGFFSEEEINAQQILIEQDGNVQIVLETELVQDIEVDGGNRKWIATANSGAFLLSPDGANILANYTSENSPLPSNNVLDIAIDHKTGEVLFGTPDGAVAFKSDATESLSGNDTPIEVIPNPVYSSFDGNISIRGLYLDSEVTITDIAGNQIIKLESNGGSTVWDGTNLNGQRVNPGVYLIYSTNDDGSEQRKGKLVIGK